MRMFLAMTIGAASLVLAQTVVPVHDEPHHATVLQNTWLRVLDVHFDAGVESLFHRHGVHNVAVRIVGGTIRSDTPDGPGNPRQVADGSVAFNSASPPYVHRVVNVGPAAVHIVDVELSGARPSIGSTSADDLARHVVEIDNEHVRVSRITLQPGESLPSHTHARGWLDVLVTGPKRGAPTWHGAGDKTSVASATTVFEVVEVEPK